MSLPKEYQSELSVTVYDGTDKIQHFFWRTDEYGLTEVMGVGETRKQRLKTVG